MDKRKRRAAMMMMMGGGGLRYLFRDLFTTDRAAGAVNGTAAEPGPNVNRQVTDTESKLTISGGNLVCAGGKATPGYGDPGLLYPFDLTREAGLAIRFTLTMTTNNGQTRIGFFNKKTGPDGAGPLHSLRLHSDSTIMYNNAAAAFSLGTYVTGQAYDCLVVLRPTGCYLAIKGGIYTEWTLIWTANENNTATVYAWIANLSNQWQVDEFSVCKLVGNWALANGIATSVSASPEAGATATTPADFVGECTWTPQAGETFEFSFRYVNDDNRLILRCAQTGTIKLIQREGGAETELNSSSGLTWTVGTPYRIVIVSDIRSVMAFVNTARWINNTTAAYNPGGHAVKVSLAEANLIINPRHTNLTGGVVTRLDPNRAYAKNAASALAIATYDGSDECTHPDVYDAGAGQTWNGYRYWMAFTPYPNADSQYENPSIVASADGTTWVVPDGLTNPIDPKPAQYNSDPELVMVGSTLWCLYRESGATDTIRGRYSSDGVTWSDEQTILTGLAHSTVSPSVVQVGGKFYLYLVDDTTTPNSIVRYEASAITGPWALSGTVTLTLPGGKEPWHLDIVYDGNYYAVVNENATEGYSIYFAVSTDGLIWTVASARLMAQSVAPGWDSSGFYRGCLVRTATGFDLWYGGTKNDGDGTYTWKIGRAAIGF